ncbi:MAG: sigma-E processing peptidase SpoIIGA, partial [Clostridia bacterium]|nr:sigma-E processing peptidase SpoIIGA [Clostridia bacterium]
MSDTLVIYIDILFFVNTVINGMIIYITSRLLGIKPSPARFAGATAIASFYGLMVCFPAFTFTLNIVFKGLAALLISLTAFKFKTIKGYLKNVCIFLFVSYTYIGLLTSFQYFPLLSNILYIKNGEIYYNLPLPYILLMTLVLCFIQNIITRFFKRQKPKESIFSCEI